MYGWSYQASRADYNIGINCDGWGFYIISILLYFSITILDQIIRLHVETIWRNFAFHSRFITRTSYYHGTAYATKASRASPKAGEDIRYLRTGFHFSPMANKSEASRCQRGRTDKGSARASTISFLLGQALGRELRARYFFSFCSFRSARKSLRLQLLLHSWKEIMPSSSVNAQVRHAFINY